MKQSSIINKILEPQFIVIVWFAVALVSGILKASLGVGEYNNFMIFRGVADHFFTQQPLYQPYPAEYFDQNYYGAIFAFIIAPFAALPHWLAMPLWVVSTSMLLYWAVRSLPIEARASALVLWIALNDLFTAAAMQQFNIATAALLVGSYVMIEKRKEGWAALFIVLGTFVKIYGIIGLAFFFFVKRKGRFVFYIALWSLVALFVPLLFVSPEYLWSQYTEWFADITAKNALNIRVDEVYQNVSILGTVRKISACPTYSDLLLIGPAILLFLGTYLRYKQFKATNFRLTMLASLLIFLVIFSSGSENSGYITAAIGVGIWWIALGKRTPLTWTLLALVFIASFSRNIFHFGNFYHEVVFRYALRAIPYFLVWLHAIYQLYTRNFIAQIPQNTIDPKLKNSDIDVVLPCYNPYPGWSTDVIKYFSSLQSTCTTHKFHLIISNDGSQRNFHNELPTLKQAVPNLTIVDNLINKGKGAAVRAGVKVSTAPLVLYTDYDFPYQTPCMSNIIAQLEQGSDIVLAARNNSYHHKLSPLRKLLSWASRNLNWFILGMNFPDAQGGLKGFNLKGKEIFLSTKVNRFLFDTEFIYKASKRPQIKISQISVNLRDGIHLPAMSTKTMRREALNFLQIIFTA